MGCRGCKPSPRKEPSITEEEKPSRWSCSYRTPVKVRTFQKLSKILGYFEGFFGWTSIFSTNGRLLPIACHTYLYKAYGSAVNTFSAPYNMSDFCQHSRTDSKLDLAVCHMSLKHLSHVGHIVLPPGGLKSCPENSKPFLKYLSNCHVFCKIHLPLPDGVVAHTGHEVRVLFTKTVASIKLRRDRNERAGLVHLGGKALMWEVFKFVSKKFSKNPRSR